MTRRYEDDDGGAAGKIMSVLEVVVVLLQNSFFCISPLSVTSMKSSPTNTDPQCLHSNYLMFKLFKKHNSQLCVVMMRTARRRCMKSFLDNFEGKKVLKVTSSYKKNCFCWNNVIARTFHIVPHTLIWAALLENCYAMCVPEKIAIQDVTQVHTPFFNF